PMWFAKNLASFDVPMFALYAGSMVFTSLLQPKAADPQQAQQQKMMTWMMPAIFGVMMWMYRWSSAFMFYWLAQNVIGLWQQWRLLHHFGPTPAPAAASAGRGEVAPPEPVTRLQPPGGERGKGTGAREPAPQQKQQQGTRREGRVPR